MRHLLFGGLLAVLGCDPKADDSGDGGGSTVSDADGDGFDAGEDCNDAVATINPSASEICDGLDNNCDGSTDEGVTLPFYADTDQDGFGDPDSITQACTASAGYVDNSEDCDDSNVGVHPNATEVCNGIDDECDGQIDDDDASVDVSAGSTFYADSDGDGYGNPAADKDACAAPSGYVEDSSDCDDGDNTINPDAIEVCDGVDNNCDGPADDDDKALDTSTATTWYFDGDGDSYGNAASSRVACDQPFSFVEDDTDCDDARATINPRVLEVCDGVDNDCNGLTDDDDFGVDTSTGETFYADTDGDGFGDPDSTQDSCVALSGYVADDSDCDDTSADINPDADEVCNDTDDDCDGDTDDADSDVDTSTGSTYYADSDGDGYGDPGDDVDACAAPSGYVSDSSDCDDDEPTANPGETEICDEIDNDCDKGHRRRRQRGRPDHRHDVLCGRRRGRLRGRGELDGGDRLRGGERLRRAQHRLQRRGRDGLPLRGGGLQRPPHQRLRRLRGRGGRGLCPHRRHRPV